MRPIYAALKTLLGNAVTFHREKITQNLLKNRRFHDTRNRFKICNTPLRFTASRNTYRILRNVKVHFPCTLHGLEEEAEAFVDATDQVLQGFHPLGFHLKIIWLYFESTTRHRSGCWEVDVRPLQRIVNKRFWTNDTSPDVLHIFISSKSVLNLAGSMSMVNARWHKKMDETKKPLPFPHFTMLFWIAMPHRYLSCETPDTPSLTHPRFPSLCYPPPEYSVGGCSEGSLFVLTPKSAE